MVSAPPPEGPTPPSPLLEPGEATTAETVESLRHAIEVQEAHVRLLRARKVAREELLHRLCSLLTTGDALEAHADVRHVVRQAEENLEHLVRTEGAVANIESGGCSGAVAAGSSTAAELDPMARVFSSAVEAQLAAIEDVRVVTHSASVDPFSEPQRARQHHKKGGNQRCRKTQRDQQQQRPASAVKVHADPQDGEVVVPPPGVTHSAATTALLVQSAAREAAGRAAMLAALETLQRALDTHSGASVSSSEPAWLRDDAEEVVEEEEKREGDEEGQPTLENVPNLAEHSSSSAASTTEYSDDFEQRSASTATSVEAPEELQDEDEAKRELP